MDTYHVFVRCPVCNKDIPKAYARQHARKEHPDDANNEVKENVFQCGECLRTFKSSRALGNHKDRSHNSNRKRISAETEKGGDGFLKCRECKKLFASKEHLRIHVEKLHSQVVSHYQPC